MVRIKQPVLLLMVSWSSLEDGNVDDIKDLGLCAVLILALIFGHTLILSGANGSDPSTGTPA